MDLVVDSLKCTGCRICEYACNYHHDLDCSAIGASLMLHRAEKKNLLLARPEGAEVVAPGSQVEGAGASSKPILMRAPCDWCEGEEEPFCVKACPTGCLSMRE
jgi:Fe-S-cluster-containing dehydrogenase component